MPKDGRLSGSVALLLGYTLLYSLISALGQPLYNQPTTLLFEGAATIAAALLGGLLGPRIEKFRQIDRYYWSLAEKNREKARRKNRERKNKILKLLGRRK